LLQIFTRIEEVSGVESVFDSCVEGSEGRGGGGVPPRFFGKSDTVLPTDDSTHL